MWSDDDIYDWFVTDLAGRGSARELEPGVIRVVIEPADDDADSASDVVDVLITREQLRSIAWAAEDIARPGAAADPVLAGLHAVSFYSMEDLTTMRPGEGYLVFDGRGLRPSVRPDLPPQRAPDEEWVMPSPGAQAGFGWSDREPGC
jgi:hypothetical protein